MGPTPGSPVLAGPVRPICRRTYRTPLEPTEAAGGAARVSLQGMNLTCPLNPSTKEGMPVSLPPLSFSKGDCPPSRRAGRRSRRRRAPRRTRTRQEAAYAKRFGISVGAMAADARGEGRQPGSRRTLPAADKGPRHRGRRARRRRGRARRTCAGPRPPVSSRRRRSAATTAVAVAVSLRHHHRGAGPGGRRGGVARHLPLQPGQRRPSPPAPGVASIVVVGDGLARGGSDRGRRGHRSWPRR